MYILEKVESVAKNCVRSAPIVFDKARGAELYDEHGRRYIDFSSGRGASAYGHGDPKVCSALIDYICNDGILQTRDRTSVAKRTFVEKFVTAVLQPRSLDYKILFTDPSAGTTTEVALRLASRHKKRSGIVSFTNGFHGLTEGARTLNYMISGQFEMLGPRGKGMYMPYCGYFNDSFDTLEYLQRYLMDAYRHSELPAAIIVEPVQIEGGVQIATASWLSGLERLCHQFDILLIVDETQTGGGRLGTYFGFEPAGVKPDIVLMPSAIAGGLPISMLLMRPALDQWRPYEEVGIFQGNNIAFVAAAEFLSHWRDNKILTSVELGSGIIARALDEILMRFTDSRIQIRGKGLIWCIDFGQPAAATVVSSWALERGLVTEPAWIRDDVLLITPPLMIEEDVLRKGLEVLTEVVSSFLSH